MRIFRDPLSDHTKWNENETKLGMEIVNFRSPKEGGKEFRSLDINSNFSFFSIRSFPPPIEFRLNRSPLRDEIKFNPTSNLL